MMEFDVEERTGKQKESIDGRAELARIERWKASRDAGREKRQIQTTVKCPERSMQDYGEHSRQGWYVSLDVSLDKSILLAQSLPQCSHHGDWHQSGEYMDLALVWSHVAMSETIIQLCSCSKSECSIFMATTICHLNDIKRSLACCEFPSPLLSALS